MTGDNPVESTNATTGEDPTGRRYDHDFGVVEVLDADNESVAVSLVDRDDHETEISRAKFEKEFDFIE